MNTKDSSFHFVALPNGNVPGNTLNNFQIRTPENLNLNTNYEVALVESSVPFNIYNIKPDSYFCIARYELTSAMKFRKTNKYRKHTITTVEGRFGKPSAEYSLDYAVRIKIPAGFFDTIEYLKNVIVTKIGLLVRESKNRLPASDNPEYYMDAISGNNPRYKEFFVGLMLGEGQAEGSRIDALNNLEILQRINHIFETGYLEFKKDPSRRAEEYFSIIRTDKETANMLGFDTPTITVPPRGLQSTFQVKIYPHDNIFVYVNILENIIVSDYESNLLRIIPLAAKKPSFGDLVWCEYQNPHYIALNTKRISYIHFTLLDAQENPIQFQHTTQNVQLVLHFRPIKPNVA